MKCELPSWRTSLWVKIIRRITKTSDPSAMNVVALEVVRWTALASMAIDSAPKMTGIRFKPQGELILSRDSPRRSTPGHAAIARQIIPIGRDDVTKESVRWDIVATWLSATKSPRPIEMSPMMSQTVGPVGRK